MSHVMTFKLPHPLLHRLEEASQKEGKSRGAFVREAIEWFLKTRSSPEDDREIIRKATEAMRLGKKMRVKVDWENLRRSAQVPSALTPEEEVMEFRRRRL